MEGQLRAAIARVCQDLGLPAGDSFSQDWAYELPEEYRTQEAWDRYLRAYSAPGYGPAEKQVLMQLILDVANDLLEQGERLEESAWSRVVLLLRAERALHKDLIEHWALMGEPLEDAFRLTPRMRAVRHRLFPQPDPQPQEAHDSWPSLFLVVPLLREVAFLRAWTHSEPLKASSPGGELQVWLYEEAGHLRLELHGSLPHSPSARIEVSPGEETAAKASMDLPLEVEGDTAYADLGPAAGPGNLLHALLARAGLVPEDAQLRLVVTHDD